jgi:hypothetical protein
VDISGHGYGHLAQVAPVIAGLAQRVPNLGLTIRSPLPPHVIRARIEHAHHILPSAFDFGVCVRDALTVDPVATFQAYERLFRDWTKVVSAAAATIARADATLVLSNISFVSVAAARAANVPAVLMSSLDWAHVFETYCGNLPGAGELAQRMRSCYGTARRTISLRPGLPMRGLPNVRRIGPIAMSGQNRRPEVAARLGVAKNARLIVFGFGGSVPPAPVLEPIPANTVLLGPPAWSGQSRFRSVDETGVPFLDLLRSCDLVVSKLGFGIVTETALAGRPFIGFTRAGWPEDPGLARWIRSRVPAAIVAGDFSTFPADHFFALTDRLLAARTKSIPPLDRTQTIVDVIVSELGETAGHGCRERQRIM